mgnify:FL=1
MKLPAALEDDAVLIGLGLLALVIFANNARGITSGVLSGVADATVGTVQGIGDAINNSVINPAVAAATGEQGATLGGKIWDWLHPRDAAGLRYGVDINGNPMYPPGALTADPNTSIFW